MGKLKLLVILLAAPTGVAVIQGGNGKPVDRTAMAQAFVEAQVKGEFTASAKGFDDVMKKGSPPDKMEAVWKQIVKEAGPFQKQLTTRQEKVDKYDVVTVTCEFAKMPLDVRVVFNSDGQISGYNIRPMQKKFEFKAPPYAKSDSFRETEVTVGAKDWPLPGTLTLPSGDGPFAAVILIQGSGPNDRDETIGPNKPFRDLAWGLASKGIAVLRFEKRTKHHAAKMVAIKDNLTIKEEVVDDALAAAAFLRTRQEIDKKRVFVLGHSLGAYCAPRIGVLDPELAGIILLAGNTRPLEDLVLEQITYIASLKGELNATDKEELEKLKKQVDRVKDKNLPPNTPAADLPLNIPASYWLALREYSQTESASKFRRPILILQGERDYQVTMADFEGWKKALDARKDVRLQSYANLNHLFMDGKGKSTPADYDRPGHVADEVINDIASWIQGKERPREK